VDARNRKGASVKSFLLNYLKEDPPSLVDRQVLSALCREADRALGRDRPVSRAYVLDVLSETGILIDRSLGGLPVDLRGRVHFHDLEAAEASLSDMTREYETARAAGDKLRAEDCRRAVRKGKDRLKLILRRSNLSAQKRKEKQELLEWFLVWLEAPPLFPAWVELRRRSAPAAPSGTVDRPATHQSQRARKPKPPAAD
jgi:hypothetical protein